MQALILAAVIAAQPSLTPLKTIVNIRSREMCDVLRESIAPAVAGVLANDKLAAQGQAVLDRLQGDAVNESSDGMGGAGADVSMDDFRAQNIVSGLVANIDKLEGILRDTQYRGNNGADASSIAAVRSRLEGVIAGQKAELNLISFVTYSNEGRSVKAKQDPTGGYSAPPPSLQPGITPFALPQQLQLLRAGVQRAEDDATKVLWPVIAACK